MNEELENQTPAEGTSESAAQPEQVVTTDTVHEITDQDIDEAVIEMEAHELPEPPHTEEQEEEEEEIHLDVLEFDKLRELFLEFLSGDSFVQQRKNFRRFRDRFREIFEENKRTALEAYLQDGGERDYFEYKPSAEESEISVKLDDTDKRFAEIKRKREQELQENFLKKTDLLDEMKKLMEDESDITKAREQFQQLREKFLATGHVPQAAAADIYNRFRLYNDNFYRSLQLHRDLFRMELSKNLEIKNKLVRQVEGLMKLPSIRKSLEYLHDYHKQWREAGPVPRSRNEELWKRFKEASDSVYRRRDEHMVALEEQRTKNLELKSALCEEAEKAAAADYPSMKDFREGDKVFAELDKKWRAIGRVPKEQNDLIWNRFRDARKAFHTRRNAESHKADAGLQENLRKKQTLLNQVKELSTSTDWKNSAQKIIRIQNDWKQIGPVPRSVSDKIWKEFREAADTFFKNKEQHQAGQIHAEKENLAKKKELITRAKELKALESVPESIAQVNALRNEWAAVGFVPFKEKQGVEKAFDDAIQAFFDQIHVDAAEQSRTDYKARVDAIVSAGGNAAYDQLRQERTALRNRSEKLREEILQLENNLLFFGNSKNADALKKPYEEKIEKAKKELENIESKQHALRNAIKVFEKK
jgi:soluble cytochrome b562